MASLIHALKHYFLTFLQAKMTLWKCPYIETVVRAIQALVNVFNLFDASIRGQKKRTELLCLSELLALRDVSGLPNGVGRQKKI